jgi:hypothetical protein
MGPPVTGLYRQRSVWDKNAPSLQRAEVLRHIDRTPQPCQVDHFQRPSIRGSQHYLDQAVAAVVAGTAEWSE